MEKALENITPMVEVKSRRVGGATFQVPQEVRAERKVSISMKNMILFSRKRGGKSMAEKLAAEIVAAFNEEAAPSRKRKICTGWPRLTRPLPISDFNLT
jgi:small subunit ribosomal protein S7